MKKLMVLALVLSVVGLANAGLSVGKAGQDTAELFGADYAVIDGAPQFAGAYVGISAGDVDVMINYGGNQWSVTDVTADAAEGLAGIVGAPIIKVLWLDFADTTPLPNTKLPNGLLATISTKVAATIYVLDAADAAVIGGPINLVPEPMTMGLLALGGLFIRRKK